jgi:general secretion pathway protein B
MTPPVFKNWRVGAECLPALFAACAACGPALAQTVQRSTPYGTSPDNTIPGGTLPSSTLSDAPVPPPGTAAPIQAPTVVVTPAPPAVSMPAPATAGQVIAQPAPAGLATTGGNATNTQTTTPQVQVLPQVPAAVAPPPSAPGPVPFPSPAPPAPPPVPPRAPLPPGPAAQPAKGLPADAPQLVISGGTYSTNPAERLVIVNGQVVGEGANLGSGVVLEQIKPETVVLGFRGSHYPVKY